MSLIGNTRQELSQLARHFTVEALCAGTTDQSINAALVASGRGKQRASPLQPKLMMWLVLSMCVFRSDAIPAVLARLLSGLREFLVALSLRPVDDDAIAHARQRLGVDPLRRFFRLQAAEVRPAPTFHGLSVWSFDGSHMTMPNSPGNRKIFGRMKTGRGRAAFPQLKLVALQDTQSRRFRDVVFRRWDASERKMAAHMLHHLGEGDLVLIDRGFYGVWFFEAIRHQGSHFLARVPAYAKFKAIPGTSKKSGDYLAWIEARVPLTAGQQVQGPQGRPSTSRVVRLLVRVIEYRIRGFERVRLVTSLLDRSISALDLILQYHRRWDIELGLDELKTHQCSTAVGTLKTIFRSQTARNVIQEAYALVASYNLVRGTMAEAAERHSLDPDKISFIGSLRAIAHMLPRMKGAPTCRLPTLYEQLLLDIAEAELDRPRRPRQYPRVVRVKMSNFKLKRPQHKQIVADFKTQIRIGA
ncbi:MAG: IS4 family transposase [Planctomycetes bacterium]|nr:IS4 family transposase [Planctomycetota bacterium]